MSSLNNYSCNFRSALLRLMLSMFCCSYAALGLANSNDHSQGKYFVYVSSQPLTGTKATSDKSSFYCAENFKSLADRIHGKSQDDVKKIEWSKLTCDESRLITKKGNQLIVQEIILYYPSNDKETQGRSTCPETLAPSIKIEISESRRKLRIIEDLTVLGQALAKERLFNEGGSRQTLFYCLSDQVTRVFSGDASNTVINTQTDPSKETTKNQYALITGPQEQWFLSIDGVLKGPKQLKYNSDKKTLSAKDQPDQVYIGINYLIDGDIYQSPGSIKDNLINGRFVGKLMIKPSKKPFDSVGLGLGYRLGLPGSKQSDGAFMIFAGSFWTKGDRLDGTDVAVDRRYTQSWRFGVSYGLNAATDWLK